MIDFLMSKKKVKELFPLSVILPCCDIIRQWRPVMEERILVFSDIHGDQCALEEILTAKDKLNADSLLSLGDLCPEGNNPIWRGIRGVRGNCDRWYEYGDLPFPPRELAIDFHGRTIHAFHGDSVPSFSPNRGDIVLFGHTHVPHGENRNGIYYCNPGSASRPRSSSGPTFGLLDASSFSVFSLLDFKRISTLFFSLSQ